MQYRIILILFGILLAGFSVTSKAGAAEKCEIRKGMSFNEVKQNAGCVCKEEFSQIEGRIYQCVESWDVEKGYNGWQLAFAPSRAHSGPNPPLYAIKIHGTINLFAKKIPCGLGHAECDIDK